MGAGSLTTRSVEEWKDRLREALRGAMRSKDADAVAALRDGLAALDNAEAADPSAVPPAGSSVVAGAVEGLGAAEVPRRALTPAQATAVVERVVRERREAAASYAELGRAEASAAAARQAAVLEALGA